MYLFVKECVKYKYLKEFFQKKEIIFDTLIENNFRTKFLEKKLKQLNIKFYYSPGEIRKEIYFKNFYKENKEYIIDTTNNDKFKCVYLNKIVSELNNKIYYSIKKYEYYLKVLKRKNIKYFFSMDEANSDVFPILYACKKLNIKTIGYQHGAGYTRWHYAYRQNGLDNFNYDWFDTILVWSEYWKLMAEKNKNYYKTNFIIARNYNLKENFFIKNKIQNNKKNFNILVPYEFLCDSLILGEYIEKMIDNNHKIYFKKRPDNNIYDQLSSYKINKNYEKNIVVIEDIDSFIDKIDCIFGSSTTYLYNFISFKKPIFIADTKFKLSIDIIKEPFAQILKFDEINIIHKYINNFKSSKINSKYYNSEKNIDGLLIKLLN